MLDATVTAPAPPKFVVGGSTASASVRFSSWRSAPTRCSIHRIERRFGRLGIPISRGTMNDLVYTAAEIARPLVARLQSRIAALEVVLADETSTRLQDRPKRGFV
jgi:hypothetical protein